MSRTVSRSKSSLALYGGTPVRKGPLPVMHPGGSAIGNEELKAVEAVLRSQSLYRFYGPDFKDVTGGFEADLAKYERRKFALGLTSGTAALHTAMVGLGIGSGDEVIIPTYAWVACPDAVVAAAARPVLADIDDSMTIDPRDVERRVTKKTKAILAVHARGVPCDLQRLREVAERHSLAIIEDVAQGAGATYRSKPLGSFGEVATFSFQLNKMITAGEGGALVTDDRETYERCVMFHDIGTPYRQFSGQGVEFSIEPFPGVNYRMNELTAAVLREQLKKIDGVVRGIRRRNAEIKKGISGLDLEYRRSNDPSGESGISLVFFAETAEKAKTFKDALVAENIRTESGGYPTVVYDPRVIDGHTFMHWGHIIKDLRENIRTHGQSLDLMTRAVHLDVSPLLTQSDVGDVIEAVNKVGKAVL
ncbi:MAG TPA: aminotransferase class I/II-fold pyridoxal phosphate-dependent enzyme [Nitrososphaerales archaeon]|nr:aminotransferase class I/II-fold pyridoxal phosphate-dependent enzyme [Nitrososphaerales archaeon]